MGSFWSTLFGTAGVAGEIYGIYLLGEGIVNSFSADPPETTAQTEGVFSATESALLQDLLRVQISLLQAQRGFLPEIQSL